MLTGKYSERIADNLHGCPDYYCAEVPSPMANEQVQMCCESNDEKYHAQKSHGKRRGVSSTLVSNREYLCDLGSHKPVNNDRSIIRTHWIGKIRVDITLDRRL